MNLVICTFTVHSGANNAALRTLCERPSSAASENEMANQQNRGQDQSSQKMQGQQQAQGQQQGEQSTYWRQQLQNEPYYQQGRQFEDYEQAYRTGEQGRAQYGSSSQDFGDNEQNLRSEYENSTRGQQNAVQWDQGGKQACEAAWNRTGSQAQSRDRDMPPQGTQGTKRGS